MSQSPATPDNDSQIDVWNTTLGAIWTEFQAQLDRQIEPLGLEAMRVLAPRAGERILDIGCGCGQTSAELAARVGPPGKVVGVDVSEPMLDVARARPIAPGAVRPFFRQIDAQTGELGHHGFDAAFSRFGVMFFSNPVAAFENIHRALKPGGRMTFVCWRPFAENLWMRGPLEAALPFLPQLPTPDYTAPGPFAFGDPERVRSILTAAGFGSVDIRPFDAPVGGSNVDQTLRLLFRIGPLGSALREHPDCLDRVRDAVRETIQRYDSPNGVFMPAAVWIVQART
jgi:SAM-dependent methyltransferase